MRLLILDQHSDVTRSFLQQFQMIGHECYIADNSIIDKDKWKPETLNGNNYMFPFRVGNLDQLKQGYFDATVTLNAWAYRNIKKCSPDTTKHVLCNAHNVNLGPVRDPKNILSFEKRALRTVSRGINKALFILSLPEGMHEYHGPAFDGDYIQLIYDFEKLAISNGPAAWILFQLAEHGYKGKRKVINYGNPGNSATDTDIFPKMFAQLHLKNWGSGNDYAILKGMSRGIAPILYEGFHAGSIVDDFITPDCAYYFKSPRDLVPLLQEIEYEGAYVRGMNASDAVRGFMLQPHHLENLSDFFDNLI